MRYISVCAGIEAATVAWEPLGWEQAYLSEIDPFPCELLHHRYGVGRPHHMPDPEAEGISRKEQAARRAAIKAVARLPLISEGPRNLGDMTQFKEWPDDDAIDLLVGGTPCQSFSVAGLRAGLADPRGNLALTYLAIAAKYRPRVVAWENVPGVLSIDGGRAFGAIIGGMAKLGYGVAYRVLDAQFCRALGLAGAVPQRRRRVLLIGYLGDWRRAAAVLFDGASLRGDSPPGRRSRQEVAGTLGASAARRGGINEGERGTLVPVDVAGTLPAGSNGTGGERQPGTSADTADTMLVPIVANPLTARMTKGVNTTADEGVTMIGEPVSFKASHYSRGKDGAPSVVSPPLSADADKGDQDPLVLAPIPFDTTQITHPENRSNPQPGDPAGTLPKAGRAPVIAFGSKDSGVDATEDISPTLRAGGFANSHANAGVPPAVVLGWRVRRLTPTECERLQGFPDGYTQIPRGNKPTADGPRYKALGNSMAVNVMRVVGQRIAMVDKIGK